MTTDDPIAEYRHLLGTIAETSRRMSEHAAGRVAALSGGLGGAERAIAAEAEAEARVVEEIGAWWQHRVASRLAHLRWISPGPRPTADPSADPGRLDEYLAQIEPASDALFAAVAAASRRGRPG